MGENKVEKGVAMVMLILSERERAEYLMMMFRLLVKRHSLQSVSPSSAAKIIQEIATEELHNAPDEMQWLEEIENRRKMLNIG